jgi:hypothetical protein
MHDPITAIIIIAADRYISVFFILNRFCRTKITKIVGTAMAWHREWEKGRRGEEEMVLRPADSQTHRPI